MEVVFRTLSSGLLQTNLGENEWLFTVLREGSIWKGRLTKEQIESNIADVRQDYAEYLTTARRIFSGSDVPNLDLTVTKVRENDIQLSWKQLSEQNVKYSLGSVTLAKCDSDMDEILENVTRKISHLEVNSQRAEAEALTARNENDILVKRMEKMAREKKELESKLFAKFILILNEKKVKIRSLLGELVKARKNNENDPPCTSKETGVASIDSSDLPDNLNVSSQKNVDSDNSFAESFEITRKVLRKTHEVNIETEQQTEISAMVSTEEVTMKDDDAFADDTLNADEMIDEL